MKESLKVVLIAGVLFGYPYASDEIKGVYTSDSVSLESSISTLLINPTNTPIFNEEYSQFEYQAFENREDEHAFSEDLDAISIYTDPALDFFPDHEDDDVELIPMQ